MDASLTLTRAPSPVIPLDAVLGAMAAAEALLIIADCIPRARPADEVAEELRLGSDYCALDRLIDELAGEADYLSDDDEKALGCLILEDLRAAKDAADRFIDRLAARRAEIEASQTFGDA